MAEIELGTLNSPEISLFLNASNNLEVQDSDGNVIATFKQDETSEFSTVNTEKVDISSISQDSTVIVEEGIVSGDIGYANVFKSTQSVGTGGKTILDATSASVTGVHADFFVAGSDTGGTVRRFQERVRGTLSDDVLVADSYEFNTPATRTYSTSSAGVLDLTMGSDSYDIIVYGTISYDGN